MVTCFSYNELCGIAGIDGSTNRQCKIHDIYLNESKSTDMMEKTNFKVHQIVFIVHSLLILVPLTFDTNASVR